MRTTLLGSLLDVAARNVARGADRLALFESGRVYLRPPTGRSAAEDLGVGASTRWPATSPAQRPAPVTEPHRFAALAVGPLVAALLARAAASRRTSSRSRACSRRWRRSSGPSSASSPARGAVPAPGPLRRGRGRRRRRRLDRRAPPAGLPRPGTSTPRSPSRSTWRRCSPPPAPARRPTRTSPPSRPSTRTSPSSSRPRSRPPSVRAAVLAGGGELLRSAEVFDLYEGEQVGEGRKSLALRLEFRAADRTLTDEEVAAAARGDQGRAGARSEGRCVSDLGAQPLDGEPAARVLVAGASGFTGALAAQIVWDHPRLELAAATSRSDAGKRLDALYPRYRVPLELTELDLDAARGDRRRDRRLPARRRGADRRRAARPRASSSSTSPPTSACATCRPTSAGTASTARRSCSGRGVYGLTELYRERAARGRAGRHPRLLPDRERAGAGAAGRSGA